MALITNERTLRPVALKKVHITDRVKHPPLLHEAAALMRLRGLFFVTPLLCLRSHGAIVLFVAAHLSIPEVCGWGSSHYFEYLSLQLSGPDLYTWFIRVKKPLTSRNLTAIIWQMVRYKAPGNIVPLRS